MKLFGKSKEKKILERLESLEKKFEILSEGFIEKLAETTEKLNTSIKTFEKSFHNLYKSEVLINSLSSQDINEIKQDIQEIKLVISFFTDEYYAKKMLKN